MRDRTASAALAAFMLTGAAACSSGSTGSPPITSVIPSSPNYSALQFAVGTANFYGTSTGLNVVSTFRQTNGASATGVNTPTITGPLGITATPNPANTSLADPYTTIVNGGPSYEETQTGAKSMTGTPQTIAAGTPTCDGNGAPPPFIACTSGITPNTSTFGQSGGVFAMGLAPYNAVAAAGQAYAYAPYAQPLYDMTSHVQFIPWGGPPAFDPDGTGLGERDGVGAIQGVDSFGNPYFLGVAEGITAFNNVTPLAGQYTLNVGISTVGNGGAISTSNVTANASLSSLATLPTITAPTVTLDANGDGGATFTATLPGGVSEAYIQVVDYGPGGGPSESSPAVTPPNCQQARGTRFAPVYYTIHITAGGTYALPPAIGPNLATSGGKSNVQPSPSICTAAQNNAAGAGNAPDDFIVQMIGFDYPIYQAALGLTQATTPQKPQIANGNGRADITISLPMESDAGGPLTPAIYPHRPLHAYHRIH